VDYVDIIKEVARYYSLPVLDLFATAGIQPKLAVQKEALCPDGLHPNDAGYRRITDRLTAFLLAL
jgi:lysophospholipase L1-like esterase